MICPQNFPPGEKVEGFAVFCGQVSTQNDVPGETIFPYEIISVTGQEKDSLVFYDSGAASSFISESLAKSWKLKKSKTVFVSLSTINDQNGHFEERDVFNVKLCNHNLELIAIKNIQTFKGSKSAPVIESRYGAKILAQDRPIDILLGVDYVGLFPVFERQIDNSRILSRSVLTHATIYHGKERFSSLSASSKLKSSQGKVVRADAKNVFSVTTDHSPEKLPSLTVARRGKPPLKLLSVGKDEPPPKLLKVELPPLVPDEEGELSSKPLPAKLLPPTSVKELMAELPFLLPEEEGKLPPELLPVGLLPPIPIEEGQPPLKSLL
jgi:hypothetical protein